MNREYRQMGGTAKRIGFGLNSAALACGPRSRSEGLRLAMGKVSRVAADGANRSLHHGRRPRLRGLYSSPAGASPRRDDHELPGIFPRASTGAIRLRKGLLRRLLLSRSDL